MEDQHLIMLVSPLLIFALIMVVKWLIEEEPASEALRPTWRRERNPQRVLEFFVTGPEGFEQDWSVVYRSYPIYRLADLHFMVDRLMESMEAEKYLAARQEGLGQLVAGQLYHGHPELRSNPGTVGVNVSFGKRENFPRQVFYRVDEADGRARYFVTLSLEYDQKIGIQIAAPDEALAEALLQQVDTGIREDSIYRNQLLQFDTTRNVLNEEDDDEQASAISLDFLEKVEISDEQIVLDAATRELLHISVIDFFERRDELAEYGVPMRRGVLLHGPPGTGKTYTGQYLASRLHGVTTIVVAGRNLTRVSSVIRVARQFQPALVVFEDVDLLFSQRQQNGATVLLGDFLESLDGFSRKDRVIFLMTTNNLERVERAIRDRPGRVSQVIEMPAPGDMLRLQFLERMLSEHGVECHNLGPIVRRTQGFTQAFLKELVYRAIQLASRRERLIRSILIDDFDEAFEMLTRDNMPQIRKILGFAKG